MSGEALCASARRVGAPIAAPPADRAARELIAELAKGRTIDSPLRHILLDLLRADAPAGEVPPPLDDAGRSAAQWIAATPAARGKALVDLLLFADALPPSGRKRKPLDFPRLESTDA